MRLESDKGRSMTKRALGFLIGGALALAVVPDSVALKGKASEPIVLQAGPRVFVGKNKREPSWPFVKVEFRSGDRVLGTADAAPWKLEGVRLDAGLHALFAVGANADGTKTCSRPVLYGVR